MRLTLLIDCRADTLTHLRRSRLGESHNQKTVDIDRILRICHTLYNSLNKHCRLTGSSRCRHKDIPVS